MRKWGNNYEQLTIPVIVIDLYLVFTKKWERSILWPGYLEW